MQNFGPEVKEKASIYVPAIGKVTIVVLLRNLLVSFPLFPLLAIMDLREIFTICVLTASILLYRGLSRTAAVIGSNLQMQLRSLALWRVSSLRQSNEMLSRQSAFIFICIHIFASMELPCCTIWDKMVGTWMRAKASEAVVYIIKTTTKVKTKRK